MSSFEDATKAVIDEILDHKENFQNSEEHPTRAIDSIEALKGCSNLLNHTHRHGEILKVILSTTSQIETKIITVKNASHTFAQARIVFSDDTFKLFMKSGNAVSKIKDDEWKEVYSFSKIGDAINRSTKEDIFNSTYDKVKKLWPKFPNEC